MSKGIYIVLACHNGVDFLAEQLDSLLGQTLAGTADPGAGRPLRGRHAFGPG